MAGAVGEVAAVLATAPCRATASMSEPRVPAGKAQHGNADHALQHQREALAHLLGRLADRHGAGDVGGAVLILRAGIEQEQLALRELAVGGARHAVVHDGAVRAGAGDGVEGDVAQRHLRFLAGRRGAFPPAW